MRITVTLDDALYQQALEMADPDMDEADPFTKSSKPSCESRRESASSP